MGKLYLEIKSELFFKFAQNSKLIFTLLSLLLCRFGLYAQQDTLFWFVAPEIVEAGNRDRPVYLRISAGQAGSIVTIDQPANSLNFAPIVLNILPNTTQSIDLTNRIDMIENKPGNTVLNYGLRIRSNNQVSIYYEVFTDQSRNPDIFSLKGLNALGTTFFAPQQTIMDNDNNQDGIPVRGGIDIVATEDNTQVTIIPRGPIVGHLANSTVNITLNKGQTWSATETSRLAANHLSGTKITSNKPIAVTVHDDFLIANSNNSGYTGGCKDLIGDQIVPVNIIGDNYVVVKGANGLNGPDRAFVVTTEPNTDIFVDGTFVTTIANEGTTYIVEITNAQGRRYINSNKPIYVYHLSGFGCEVGAALIPPLLCNGSRSVTVTRSVNNFMGVTLIVRNGGQQSFSFNGNALTAAQIDQFAVVPGTNNEWVSAQIEIANTFVAEGNNLRVENSTNMFHLGIINGNNSVGARYGYFSNFNKYLSVPSSNSGPNNPICEGDTLKIFSPSNPFAVYNWSGPNGLLPQVDTIVIPNVTLNDQGIYTLFMNVEGCLSDTNDTEVVLNPIPPPPTNLTVIPNPVCRGESAELNAQSGVNNILWFDVQTGGIHFANAAPNVGVSVTHLNNITYYASSLSPQGCLNDARVPIDAEVIQPPDDLAYSLSSVCIFPEPNNYFGYTSILSEFIVSIQDNGIFDIQNTVATVEAIHPAPITYNGVIYMQRATSVTSPTQESTRMRLYFSQDEYDNLVSAHGLLNGMQHLRVTKFDGEIDFPAGIGELMPIPTVIQNYNGLPNVHALEFDVTCCSTFFIHFLDTIINPLSIKVDKIETHCEENSVLVEWESSSSYLYPKTILQRSSDNYNYQTIHEEYNVFSNNSILKYSFRDYFTRTDKLYYRLISENINGEQITVAKKKVECDDECVSLCNIKTILNERNIQLQFNSANDQSIKIELIRSNGQVLNIIKTMANEGLNTIFIENYIQREMVLIRIFDERNSVFHIKLML